MDQNVKVSIFQVYGDSLVIGNIDCHTDLTVVSLCTDLAEKDLLPDVTFLSFLGQEIARNKNQGFPDLVPFPLPISGEVLLFLLVITGRKIDSDLPELTKEGELT